MILGQTKKQKNYGVCVCFAMALCICHSAQFFYEPPIFIDVDSLAEQFQCSLKFAFEGLTLKEFMKKWNELHWTLRLVKADQGLLYVMKIRGKDIETFEELWRHAMIFANMPMVVCCVRTEGSDEPDHAVAAVEGYVDEDGHKIVYAANSQSERTGRSSVEANRYTIREYDFNGTEPTECKIVSADFSEMIHACCDECIYEGATKEADKTKWVPSSKEKEECRQKNLGDPNHEHPYIEDLYTNMKYDFYINKAEGMMMVWEGEDEPTTVTKGTPAIPQAGRSKKQTSGKAKSNAAPALQTPRKGIQWEAPAVSPKKRARGDDGNVGVIEIPVPDEPVGSRYAGLVGEQYKMSQITAHQNGRPIKAKCIKDKCVGTMVGTAETAAAQATLRCFLCGTRKVGARYGAWYWG